jgi:hypothetical protein
VKRDSTGEDLADHIGYIVQLERNPLDVIAHAAASAVFHFGILHVVPCVWKRRVIAGVIEMHVRDNYIFDLFGIKPYHAQAFADRTKQHAISFHGSRCVEPGVEDKAAFLTRNRADILLLVSVLRLLSYRISSIATGVDCCAVIR